jgi:hypothetical protein
MACALRVLRTAAFSPALNKIAFAAGEDERNLEISRRTLTTGRVRTLPSHQNPILALSFSSDGSKIASSCAFSIRLWDAETGRSKAPIKSNLDVHGHWSKPDSAKAIAPVFSPDGCSLAAPILSSNTSPRRVGLWDVASGVRITDDSLADDLNLYAMYFTPGGESCYVLSHHDKLCAPGSEEPNLSWDGQESSGSSISTPVFESNTSPVAAMKVLDQKVLMAVGFSQGRIKIRGTKTSEVKGTLQGYRGPTALAFSVDGGVQAAEYTITPAEKKLYKAWESASKKELPDSSAKGADLFHQENNSAPSLAGEEKSASNMHMEVRNGNHWATVGGLPVVLIPPQWTYLAEDDVSSVLDIAGIGSLTSVTTALAGGRYATLKCDFSKMGFLEQDGAPPRQGVKDAPGQKNNEKGGARKDGAVRTKLASALGSGRPAGAGKKPGVKVANNPEEKSDQGDA